MEKIICKSCNCEIDQLPNWYGCPVHCPICGESICPDCGGLLTNEENYIEYCGDGCSDCDWSHCGGCE